MLLSKRCVFGILLLIVCSCGQRDKQTTESKSDQVISADSVAVVAREQEKITRPGANEIIKFAGTVDDSVKIRLESFQLLIDVQRLAQRAIGIKDSIEYARKTQDLVNPSDSAIFKPHFDKAYQAILNYKDSMALGIHLRKPCPSLVQLRRGVLPGDSTAVILPKAGKSQAFTNGRFFFLGGAPFVEKLVPQVENVFTDKKGKPESRFACSITENTTFALNSIYHFRNGPIAIQFGLPLSSYSSGPQEISGIGSLIHEFPQPIPAFFLTEKGSFPAQLISISVKLVEENLGCISDNPDVTFACSTNLEAEEILAIYVPYQNLSTIHCNVTRSGPYLWIVDLNNDGVADLACVSGTTQGISSDAIAEVLWFVNMNGNWKIIDHGSTLDCT